MNHDLLTVALADDEITTKLVYADWLEPRGESLGELIRLACAIRLKQTSNLEEAKYFLLETEVLTPLIAACRAAIPACNECKDIPLKGRRGLRWSCSKCNDTININHLWLNCPECEMRARNGVYRVSPVCAKCDGYRVLLKIECPKCTSGGQWVPKWVREQNAEAHGHVSDGYIDSPLLTVWQILKLTYDPRADSVRHGDMPTILKLFEEFGNN